MQLKTRRKTVNQKVINVGLRPTYGALEIAYPLKSMPRAELYDELGIARRTNLESAGQRITTALARSHAKRIHWPRA